MLNKERGNIIMKWLKKVAATPLTSIARVIDSLQIQTNDRTNAPSIRAVNEAIKKNWLTIYPIGSIYMCVNDINPSEVFGGTWVQIKDRFLLAAGDTYNNGAMGGAATHTPSGTVGGHAITVAEMPTHAHGVRYLAKSLSGGEISANTIDIGSTGQDADTSTRGQGQAHSHTFTGTSQDTMPPYLAVKVWKRTA